MNLRREIYYLILEILFSIFVIFFGYYILNNFDKSSIDIAKSYSNTKQIAINLEDNDTILSNNEEEINANTLYLHNISSKNNAAKLLIKINKSNDLFKTNTILKINNNYYNLEDMDYFLDDNYIYIIIKKIAFDGYETKELNIKLLTKEKVNNVSEYLNYEFVTKV